MYNALKTITATLIKIVRHGAPSHILYFGDSLGDNLLITTLAAAMRKNGCKNIWVRSNKTELFTNNPDIALVLPFNTTLSTTILKFCGTKISGLQYATYNSETDHDTIPPGHIVQIMAMLAGLNIDIANKPVMQLTHSEKLNGKYFKNQIVIVNSGAGAAVHQQNKEWYADRFQQIVDRFKDQFQFIQLGTKYDPVLDNVMDLRGKTTLRESASILKASVLLVSYAGFLMHMARAVDCRAVIVYGGKETPQQTGYECFENLYSNVPCSPCWLRNRCDKNRICMDMITVDHVEAAILKQLELTGTPLPVNILPRA